MNFKIWKVRSLLQQSHDLHMVCWLSWLSMCQSWRKKTTWMFLFLHFIIVWGETKNKKVAGLISQNNILQAPIEGASIYKTVDGCCFFTGRDDLITVRWDMLSRLLPCLLLRDTEKTLCVQGMGNSSSQWVLLFNLMMCVLIRTDPVNMGLMGFDGATTSRFL